MVVGIVLISLWATFRLMIILGASGPTEQCIFLCLLTIRFDVGLTMSAGSDLNGNVCSVSVMLECLLVSSALLIIHMFGMARSILNSVDCIVVGMCRECSVLVTRMKILLLAAALRLVVLVHICLCNCRGPAGSLVS